MNRIVGFMLFFVGIGMLIELMMPTTVWTVVTAAVCLVAGYYLFCCS